METTEAPAQARWAAGRWQREHAQSLEEWRKSGASLATPHLTTLCRAVNETARELSSDPHALSAKLPPTRTCCDDLCFQDYDEAAAYTVQHLTDRYGRVTQEELSRPVDQLVRWGLARDGLVVEQDVA
jgi:hypothetical protein